MTELKNWFFRGSIKGEQFLFRPLTQKDAPLLEKLFYSLSEESILQRFFAPIKEIPPGALEPLINIDYQDKFAICAIPEFGDWKDSIVGVGRYAKSKQRSDSADFAVLIQDSFHNKGLGKILFTLALHRAKEVGFVYAIAQVLSTNLPMIHILRKYEFKPTGAEQDVLIFERALDDTIPKIPPELKAVSPENE